MTDNRDENAKAAIQYLTWALQHIGKAGNQKAARYVRLALEALRSSYETRNDAAG